MSACWKQDREQKANMGFLQLRYVGVLLESLSNMYDIAGTIL